ncbi:hypothetical protein AURDEDRAFT_124730 [Auricularia subglabra TFB-10046 SS5]|nr:hypothetical protein AURDEDRAFT_124730 [Auricularia subglabra TFB-10046 SS5]
MPGILFNSLLGLRYPVFVKAPDLGCSFNTYLAASRIDGHEFCFSVAQPLMDDLEPLLPNGMCGDVQATLTLHEGSVLLSATSVSGMYVAGNARKPAETRKLFQPVLTFAGKVTRVYAADVDLPTVKAVDITVECRDTWPYVDTVVKCYFNRRERVFRFLAHFEVGMLLCVTGELAGWEAGNLFVDVNEVGPDNSGDLPARALVAVPNLFEHLNYVNKFALFRNPSTLPPRGGLPASLAGATTTSSQWLQIATGVPYVRQDTANTTAGQQVTSPAPGEAQATSASASTSAGASAAGYIARRAVAARGMRRRRTPAFTHARSPLAELDMNVVRDESMKMTVVDIYDGLVEHHGNCPTSVVLRWKRRVTIGTCPTMVGEGEVVRVVGVLGHAKYTYLPTALNEPTVAGIGVSIGQSNAGIMPYEHRNGDV